MDRSYEQQNDLRIRPYRKDFGYSYTCGVFPTVELLKKKPEQVMRVILSSRKEEGQGPEMLRSLAEELGIPAVTDDRTLERISSKENCIASGVFLKYTEELDMKRNHIVLVNPRDMGNLGTILRTSSAFGFEDVGIIRPCCDIFDPKAVRASMGALFGVRVKLYDSFDEYASEALRTLQNIYPFMLKGERLTDDIADRAYGRSLKGEYFTIVFGNESSGLPDEFLSKGRPVRIPQRDTVDSLNLPVAVSVGEYMFSGKGAGI